VPLNQSIYIHITMGTTNRDIDSLTQAYGHLFQCFLLRWELPLPALPWYIKPWFYITHHKMTSVQMLKCLLAKNWTSGNYRNLSMNPSSHTGVFSNYIFGQTCDNHVVRVVRFCESNKSIQILGWSTQWRKRVFWDQKHVQHAITVIAVELTLSPVLSCRRRIPNAMYFEPISWLMLILLSLPRNLTHL